MSQIHGKAIGFAATATLLFATPVQAQDPEQPILSSPHLAGYSIAQPDAQPLVPGPITATRACVQSSDPAEITVCARTNQPSDRLDPEVLRAERLANATPASPTALQSAMRSKCEPTSHRGCPGRDVIPLSAIALTTVHALILAATGDDWRNAFPAPSPTAYDIYRDRNPGR